MSDDTRLAAAALTPGAHKADRPPPQSPGGPPAAAPGGDTLPAAGDQTAAREPPVDRLSPTVDYEPPAPADEQFAPTVDFVPRGTKSRSSPTSTGLVVGDYQIESELGRGGMGVVYRAHDRKLNRVVALKMILAGPHADAQALARFRVEGQAVARLAHPGIVQIFELGEHEGLPFFALEFVGGGNLLRQVVKELPSPAEAARLVEQLARIMQHAHDQGILHRDLKPANILLTPEGEPKISDFGLAKPIDAEEGMTRTGSILGTPEYMSPEQAKGLIANLTPATDQYSLGAILYHLLTGRPPFLSDNPIDTVFQVIVEEPVTPRRLAPKVPADLETICLKAIAKEPARRYASCRELAEDLHRFLAGEPIMARPASRVERAWRWCRRNPRIAVPTGVSAALFLIAFAVVSWSAWALSRLNGQLTQQTNIATAATAQAQREALAANTARQESDKRADALLQSVQVLLTSVQARIGRTPGLQPLKKDILRAAAASLASLPGMTGKSGATTQASELIYHRLMYDMYLEIGDTDAAWKAISHAHDIARNRLQVQNHSTASRLNLANVCRDMSRIRRQYFRDLELSQHYAREAVGLYEDILASPRPPSSDQLRLEITDLLSQSHSGLATGFMRLGDPAQALAHFEREQSLRNGLLSDPVYLRLTAKAKEQNEARFRPLIATTLGGIGEMQFRLDRPTEAKTNYVQSVALLEQSLVEQKSHWMIKAKLAGMLSQAGNLFMRLGEPKTAAAYLDRSIAMAKELTESDPEIVEYQQLLALSLFRRGVLQSGEKDPSVGETLESCRKIREALAKDAANIDRQRELLLVLPRCGKHGEAVALADKILAAVPKPDIELLLDLARAYAQCSVAAAGDAAAAEAFQKQALGRLAQVVEAGHRDPVYLQHEPDFEPLRKHERFQALVAQAKMAADKSVK